MGLDVRVVKGLSKLEAADLVVPHINLTVTPRDYQAALETLPNVLNRGLYDISKRRISTQLLNRGDDWDGPVIIKTNQNSGGKSDRRIVRLQRPMVRRMTERLQRRWTRQRLSPLRLVAERAEYQVLNSVADVPPAIWSDPELVVERFLPERDDRLYYVHWYIFIGNRYRCIRAGAPHPLVKLSSVAYRETGVPIPPQVLEFRRRHRVDFGKIDFVMHEGTPVVLDLNRTPADEPPPTRLAICRPYAPGVLPLLDGRRPSEHYDIDN